MTIKALVERINREAEGIASFELVHPNGQDLPAFTAGSHIDVHISAACIRQYSLCNSPKERRRYLIAVQKERDGRGGSIAMHERIRPGMLLDISEPRNLFPLASHKGLSLLIAGGIGITPIISMAEDLAASVRPFEVHYFTRGTGRTAFFPKLTSEPLAGHTHLYHMAAPEARQQFAHLLNRADPAAHVYVCGPPTMIDAVLALTTETGWPRHQIHYERFSASSMPLPARQKFHVKIASTGQLIEVQEGRTVLEALEAEGILVMSSCRQGSCGTCLTTVISGIPDHRDSFLSDNEKLGNNCFTPCCSWSKTDELVLDL